MSAATAQQQAAAEHVGRALACGTAHGCAGFDPIVYSIDSASGAAVQWHAVRPAPRLPSPDCPQEKGE